MATVAEPQLLSSLLRIPIDRVQPGPNARGDVGDVTELAQSIKTLGMQKPLLVCDLGDGRYEILDGHRRHAAAKRVGLTNVDAVLRKRAPGALRIQQQLAMHAQSKSFDPIAEAKALHTLMWEHNLTREQIAAAVGKSPGWVRDRIGLLQLSPVNQGAVAAGRLPIGQALLMVKATRGERDGRVPAEPKLAPRVLAAPAAHCRTCCCGVTR